MIVQQHITGLEITMHDRRSLRVHIGEHVAQLAHPGCHHLQRHALVGRGTANRLQRSVTAELKHHIDHAIGDFTVSDTGNRWMFELGEDAALVLVVERFGDLFQRPALIAELLIFDQIG